MLQLNFILGDQYALVKWVVRKGLDCTPRSFSTSDSRRSRRGLHSPDVAEKVRQDPEVDWAEKQEGKVSAKINRFSTHN